MKPYFSDGQVTLYLGHVMDVLRAMPAESVQCVVTSPPYWSLRSYGTEPQVWGGDANCAHTWERRAVTLPGIEFSSKSTLVGSGRNLNYPGGKLIVDSPSSADVCPCGAWRGELGHEPTPQMFVAHLVEVFREVKRVLKPDGCCFVNLGDSYAGSGKGPTGHNGIGDQEKRQGFSSRANRPRNGLSGGTQTIDESYGAPTTDGLRAKSLVLIPERFALAMADDGWICRSRIAWCKRAPMPESVRDRPTNAWEHIWMFTKSARYYWDAEAVREQLISLPHEPGNVSAAPGKNDLGYLDTRTWGSDRGRNQWSYWLLSPDPEPEAHFATFPKEIPRRCIAAATSERCECPHCGKSWVRVVRKGPSAPEPEHRNPEKRLEPGQAGNHWAGNMGFRASKLSGQEMARWKAEHPDETTGWQPQCECPPHEPRPSTVLDPFTGSGTTNLVARSMGRYSVGIDLSESYLRDIALKKNAQMGLMVPMEEPA